jgi:hypothetical protein
VSRILSEGKSDMRKAKFSAALLVLVGLATPFVAHGDPLVENPFGSLQMKIVRQPAGGTPGVARLTITTGDAAALTPGHPRVYFGLRIMGSEDTQMLGFQLPANKGRCIVSDFAGNNVKGGWQGAQVFGAAAPALGSANSHMRMIGGYLQKNCGNVIITISFSQRPLIAYYAAFFGYNAAPWHSAYKTAPWSTIPTGGNARYQNWWDLWGRFDTLGYSNACTSVSGNAVSC